VDLLDEQQKGSAGVALGPEQRPDETRHHLAGVRLPEVARHVHDDRDALLQGQRRQPVGVARPDLQVTAVVRADVEHLVRLLQPVVLPVGVDDGDREPEVQ
jgi:hypothetical protein